MNPHFITEFLVAAASTLAAGRLLYLGLGKRFSALVAWLFFLGAASLSLAVLSPKTSLLYFQIYVVAIPLYCIFGIMAVRELIELVFSHYPGIRTIGRWAMYGGIGLATTTSLLLTRLFWSTTATGRALSGVYYLQLGHRSVVFTLAIVIISLLYSISRYPLHLERNIRVSSGFFGAVFLSETAQSLMDSLGPRLHNDYVDWTANVVVMACLCAWAARLQREAAPATARGAFSSPVEDHLLRELASLNQVLARAARR